MDDSRSGQSMDPAFRLSFIHKVNVAHDRLADRINIAAQAGGERPLRTAASWRLPVAATTDGDRSECTVPQIVVGRAGED